MKDYLGISFYLDEETLKAFYRVDLRLVDLKLKEKRNRYYNFLKMLNRFSLLFCVLFYLFVSKETFSGKTLPFSFWLILFCLFYHSIKCYRAIGKYNHGKNQNLERKEKIEVFEEMRNNELYGFRINSFRFLKRTEKDGYKEKSFYEKISEKECFLISALANDYIGILDENS